jgi:hypothetical protein
MPLHIAVESSAPEEVVRLLIEAHPDAIKEKDKVSKENKEKNQKGKNLLYSKKEILEASKRIKEMIQA